METLLHIPVVTQLLLFVAKSRAEDLRMFLCRSCGHNFRFRSLA